MNTIPSISAFHRLLSLPEPRHPLVSVISLDKVVYLDDEVWKGFVNAFYCVALKRGATGKIRYGQQHYDYDKGVLSFTAPNQVQYLDLQTVECGSGSLLVMRGPTQACWKHQIPKTAKPVGERVNLTFRVIVG